MKFAVLALIVSAVAVTRWLELEPLSHLHLAATGVGTAITPLPASPGAAARMEGAVALGEPRFSGRGDSLSRGPPAPRPQGP